MKRHDILIAALAAVVALGATASYARSGGGHDPAEMFGELDIDGNGQVTAEEVDAARDARFAEADTDGDGVISKPEFIAHAQGRAGDRAERMFDRLDADGDGVLSRDAVEAQGRRGPDARMIARLDADGDGAVTLEEFEAGMERFAERRGKRGGFGHRDH